MNLIRRFVSRLMLSLITDQRNVGYRQAYENANK